MREATLRQEYVTLDWDGFVKLDEGTLIGNRFRLVRILGRGGMGSVWLADHLTLGVRCALKFIEGEAQHDAGARARFEREARMAAQLKTPHVVQVLDYGVCDGTPYIAMEFLQGENLAARLERVGRLDAAETYSVVAQVARGLAKAHAAGIVHRDLKPENIFLAQEDEGENCKILDFGIAKLAAFPLLDSATKTGTLFGTPFYMSPEQARGTRKIDHRSDLWSLGIIAFQCLTGRLPFTSEALGDLLAQIIFDPIPVPSRLGLSLPLGFDMWWMKAASRDPEGRFASAKQLADTLADALSVGDRLQIASILPRPPAPSLSDVPRATLDSSIPPPPPWIVTPPAARAAAHRELLSALAAEESEEGDAPEGPDPRSDGEEADFAENPFVRSYFARAGAVVEHRYAIALGVCVAIVAMGAAVALRPQAPQGVALAGNASMTEPALPVAASPLVAHGDSLAPSRPVATEPTPGAPESPRPSAGVGNDAKPSKHAEKSDAPKSMEAPRDMRDKADKSRSDRPRRPKAASPPDFGI